MKKRYLILPLFLFLAVSVAWAQTGLESKRAQMDAKRAAVKTQAEAKRQAAQTKRVAFQQDVARRKTQRTAQVILATVGRLENIIARLESRIVKVRARSGVTSESEGFVAAARGNLFDARQAVDAFSQMDLSGERAADNFARIRTAAAGAREHIRTAHQNLMKAVRALGSIEARSGTATTSAAEQ